MFFFNDPSEMSEADIIEQKALNDASVGAPLALTCLAGIGGFFLSANIVVGAGAALLPAYLLVKKLKRSYKSHIFVRRFPDCYAHLIDNDRDMIQWLEIHGNEEVGEQLLLARKHGQPLTSCAKRTLKALLPEEAARKYKVETFLEGDNLKPELPYTPGPNTQLGAIEVPAQTVPEAAPQQWQPPEVPHDDIAKSLAESLQSTLIVGQPGAGKGLTIAYATRWIKKLHPECQIWVIDPKSDPSEAQYWQACDRILNCPFKPFTPEEEMDRIKSDIDQFIAAFQNEQAPMKLLIFDEALAVKEKTGKWMKGTMAGFNSLCSMGRSKKEYGWLVSQSPNADDYGISGGTRNVYRRILLIAKSNQGLLANGSTFFSGKPSPDQLDTTGRVFFDSAINGWGITPVYPDLVDTSKKSDAVPHVSRRESLERSLSIDIPSPEHENLYHSPENASETDAVIDEVEIDELAIKAEIARLLSENPNGLKVKDFVNRCRKPVRGMSSEEIRFYLDEMTFSGEAIEKDSMFFPNN